MDSLIIGSIALDTISKLDEYHMNDSNPGNTTTSIGGVGHNVALASYYTKGNIKFVSVVGDDYTGRFLQLQTPLNHQLYIKAGATATYTAIHDPQGELIVASADMKIIETNFSNEIKQEIDNVKPKNVVMDCNLSLETIQEIYDYSDANIIVEPTSLYKSQTLGDVNISVHKPIQLITPTVNELEAIYNRIEQNEKFDDEWFEIIDSLELHSIRDILRGGMIKQLYDQGIIQKGFKLLPFYNNLIIKLGDKGVLSIGVNNSKFFNVDTKGSYPFYIDYYPIPKENQNLNIVNVTGAGDTLLGYIISNLDKPKSQLIYNGQLTSGLSLISQHAINEKIKDV